MTATSIPTERATARTRFARLVAPPRTGWASVGLLGLMLVVAGLAMDLPRIVGSVPGGDASQTGFLPVTMLLAGLVGVILARLPLPVTLAHLLGSIVGVGVLLVAWAGALSSDPSLWERLRAVDAAATGLFQDMVIDRKQRTDETIGFLVVVGAVAWTTGQFAAYNLVRRGLVAPGIVSIGTLVLIFALGPNVDAARIYPHLVVVTGAALVLVLRANLAHQQAGWRRRRIVGGQGVGRSFMRGGVVVCLVAVVGATGLAGSLVGSPLRDTATSMDDRLLQIAQLIEGWFGGMSPPGSATGSYGDEAPITDTWTTDATVMFRGRAEDGGSRYWRGAAYRTFTGRTWIRDARDVQARSVPPGAELLTGTADLEGVGLERTRLVEVEVTNEVLDGKSLLAPAVPDTLDRQSDALLDGDGGPFLEIEFRDAVPRGDRYIVQSRVWRQGERGITQNLLAAAGTSTYPAWVQPYTQYEPSTLGNDAVLRAERIATEPGAPTDPFHVAARIEAYFAGLGRYADDGDDFRYATDVQGVCSPVDGVVTCLLREKVGFCVQYATAMTLMLRSRGIPARYVLGFLPGELEEDGRVAVRGADAHAWVEAFFPGYGWIQFDPTPGGDTRNGQTAQSIELGEPVPTPTPLPSVAPTPTPDPTLEPTPTPSPTPPSPPGPEASSGMQLPWVAGLLVAAAVLVLTVAWAVRRAQRVPGRSPEVLYRAITVLAARTGRGPRPEQTPYEFTDALGASIPGAAADLHAVARARVEATYGGRQLDGSAVDGLIASFRRARRALRGLFLRRPSRRG